MSLSTSTIATCCLIDLASAPRSSIALFLVSFLTSSNIVSLTARFMSSSYEGQSNFTFIFISISVKPDALAGLPVNKYGEVKLYVGKLKQKNEKSKATHYVAVAEERTTLAQDPIPETTQDLPF